MSYDDSLGTECVCDALGEQANLIYNVIAKTVGVANQRPLLRFKL